MTAMITVNDLRVAFNNHPPDSSEPINVKGLEFFYGYLKYLLEYLDGIGLSDNDVVDFTDG